MKGKLIGIDEKGVIIVDDILNPSDLEKAKTLRAKARLFFTIAKRLEINQDKIISRDGMDLCSTKETVISDMGNSLGDLAVKQECGKFFWSIGGYEGVSWSEISEDLYLALLSHNEKQKNRCDLMANISVIDTPYL